MTGPRQPWWYSGDDEEPLSAPEVDAAGESEPAATGGGAGGLDWTALVVGAQRVVEWATERVMAPHAEHADPADHPDCVVCRTMVVLGEPGPGPAAPPPDEAADPQSAAQEAADPVGGGAATRPRGAGEIQWIPIRDAVVKA